MSADAVAVEVDAPTPADAMDQVRATLRLDRIVTALFPYCARKGRHGPRKTWLKSACTQPWPCAPGRSLNCGISSPRIPAPPSRAGAASSCPQAVLECVPVRGMAS